MSDDYPREAWDAQANARNARLLRELLEEKGFPVPEAVARPHIPARSA